MLCCFGEIYLLGRELILITVQRECTVKRENLRAVKDHCRNPSIDASCLSHSAYPHLFSFALAPSFAPFDKTKKSLDEIKDPSTRWAGLRWQADGIHLRCGT